MATPEQLARDMLERMGVDSAQQMTAGDLVELANLIAAHDHLQSVLAHISTAASGNEIYPVGPRRTRFAEDGNTVLGHDGPWLFCRGQGDTFLQAVEDDMARG